MPDLILRNREIRTVFQLLGEQENDITFSVAWALARSSGFTERLVTNILGIHASADETTIRIQVNEKDAGITDIEIESPGQFFIIIEAKKGWTSPTLAQLAKYVRRRSFLTDKHIKRAIVPLSECGTDFTLRCLDCNSIEGVPIIPLDWQTVFECAKNAACSSHAEKRLLQELQMYLRGVISMQSNDSNWVYVVSLGAGTPSGWKVSWKEIVEKHRAYFHVIGKTWPKVAPNYIAFRYGGRLQSIHHVEAFETFTDPHDKFPGIPDRRWEPHILYKLGRGFAPDHDVPTGKIYPNGRVWCMLDTLFTSPTLADARDISKKRGHGVP